MSDVDSKEKRHPIQVVARRTGLSLDLLRAWERRYEVVEPGRTEGGRRLYSDEDVEHLRMLKRASDAGRRISQIASLGTDELAALVEEDQREALEGEAEPAAPDLGASIYLKACLAAVERLDALELEATLNRALVNLSAPALIDGVVGPLLGQIGELWSHGTLRPAHEHLASSIVVRILVELIQAAEPSGPAPNLVVATPPGQLHEFGALFVAVTAASEGWGVTYLGRDLPGSDIAAAANEKGAEAVALSIVFTSTSGSELQDELETLREALPADVPIFAGGASAENYRDALEAIGAERLEDLNEFRLALRALV